MRPVNLSKRALVMLSSATILLVNYSALSCQPSSAQDAASPVITNAIVKGKNLLVTGINFSRGATIFIQGKKFKTKNDPNNPETVLVAKKGGKKIKPQEIVGLQVRNSDGIRSEVFSFFTGRIVTIEDSGKIVELAVGERFVVLLKKPSYEWALTVEDTSIIRKLDEVVIEGAQGLFIAERQGETRLVAIGELPCHKSSPPCLAPSLAVEIRIIVK